MKNIFYVLPLFLIFSACINEDFQILEPLNTVIGEIVIDSIETELLNLDQPNARSYFSIYDFTTKVPGQIWGTTRGPDNFNSYNDVFSYDLSTNEIEIYESFNQVDIMSLKDIDATSDGKLYLTSQSLYRSIAVFDTQNGEWSTIEVPGLIFHTALDVRNDNLWIAHTEGITLYNNDEQTTYNRSNSILLSTDTTQSFRSLALTVDRDGVVWYGLDNDLYLFKDGAWSLHPSYPTIENSLIWQIEASPFGGVLIYADHGNTSLLDVDGLIKNYENIGFLSQPDNPIQGLSAGATAESVVYSSGSGIYYYNAELNQTIRINDGDGDRYEGFYKIRNFERDQNGHLWVGGDNYLARLPAEW